MDTFRSIGDILPNFVKITQSIAEISRFFNCLGWRPSAILDMFGAYRTTHEGYLAVFFIIVQNLVTIDAVLSII